MNSHQSGGLSASSTTSASSSSLASQGQQYQQHAPVQNTAPAQQPSSTAAHLRDFTLVAEAVKRAQVDVMIRDFEDCGL